MKKKNESPQRLGDENHHTRLVACFHLPGTHIKFSILTGYCQAEILMQGAA